MDRKEGSLYNWLYEKLEEKWAMNEGGAMGSTYCEGCPCADKCTWTEDEGMETCLFMERIRLFEQDQLEIATMFTVELPEPGSDLAKVMAFNRQLVKELHAKNDLVRQSREYAKTLQNKIDTLQEDATELTKNVKDILKFRRNA